MTNQRAKGARGERFFANKLKEFFPNITRNYKEQAAGGGTDLDNTPGFSFEVKFGKAYSSKMIRNIIDQVQSEGKKDTLKVALVKPDREKEYAIIPFKDFLKLLKEYFSRKIAPPVV